MIFDKAQIRSHIETHFESVEIFCECAGLSSKLVEGWLNDNSRLSDLYIDKILDEAGIQLTIHYPGGDSTMPDFTA